MTTEQENRSSDAQILAATSLVVEDLEDASDALLALKREHKLLAHEVALKILRKRIGDVFYRALAFEVLYSVALDDAIAYIELNARTENTYVLGAMVEVVTEDVGALAERDKILRAVSFLKTALKLRSPDELSLVAIKKARFEEAYR